MAPVALVAPVAPLCKCGWFCPTTQLILSKLVYVYVFFFRPEMGGQILASTSTNSSPDTKYWLRGPRLAEPQLQAAGCRIDAVCGCQNFWPRQCWCNICGIVVPTLTCGLRLSIATFSCKREAWFKLGVGHRLVPGCHPRRGT